VFQEFFSELVKVARIHHDLSATLAVKIFEMRQQARGGQDVIKSKRQILSALRMMGDQGWIKYMKKNS
jgi:hypothetical protein